MICDTVRVCPCCMNSEYLKFGAHLWKKGKFSSFTSDSLEPSRGKGKRGIPV